MLHIIFTLHMLLLRSKICRYSSHWTESQPFHLCSTSHPRKFYQPEMLRAYVQHLFRCMLELPSTTLIMHAKSRKQIRVIIAAFPVLFRKIVHGNHPSRQALHLSLTWSLGETMETSWLMRCGLGRLHRLIQ